jgi:hypothetical protein
MSISYSEYESVALGTQSELRVRHIVICGLSWSTIFISHYLINCTIFEKKNVIEYKMCVLSFSTTFIRKISHCKKN